MLAILKLCNHRHEESYSGSQEATSNSINGINYKKLFHRVRFRYKQPLKSYSETTANSQALTVSETRSVTAQMGGLAPKSISCMKNSKIRRSFTLTLANHMEPLPSYTSHVIGLYAAYKFCQQGDLTLRPLALNPFFYGLP